MYYSRGPRGKNVDGMAVVTFSEHTGKDDSLTKTLHTVQDNGVPLVLLDRAVYSIFSDFVTTDNKYGGRAAAEKLCAQGRNKSVVFWGRRRSIRQKALSGFSGRCCPHQALPGTGCFSQATEESGRTAFETLYAQGCDGFCGK
ncbi:MAG: hypothetical protein ACLSB9_27210 [Hydrogeniiclostridium mannosilyticum]